ncbi:hypothetical protein [Bacillus sinesaloumensis]|uniref:hypothetical protein n=1 Tax=Litchfieldia sinesaloumensis TaxID=1926280 RepID=UPI00098843EC|nr:hypothetical protein [Bacillus sinesaloumensis]
MKRKAEQLIEEISDFLVIYLKSGKVGLNSFIKKTDLQIEQVEQLLDLHFLLKEEVKQFVRELPMLIRRLKTSTKVQQDTAYGNVRGQINWHNTMKERLRINATDRTIYSVGERSREYAIKENLVLLEVLNVLHAILFVKIDTEHYKKYAWFDEWMTLKDIIGHMINKNVYLSRIQMHEEKVTSRMIVDTMKHRNPLYKQAGQILYKYHSIMEGNLDKEDIVELLKETFIMPEKEDVLFELYWVIKIIQANTEHAQLQIMDGRNKHNLVAEWKNEQYAFKIYHDSSGSEKIKFQITTDEVEQIYHPYIARKLASTAEVDALAREIFGQGIDKSTFWSGRPDIIVEIYDKRSEQLKKVFIGEVKHTSRIEYAITGLRELIDYMKFVKDEDGNYLEEQSHVEVQGILFTEVDVGDGRKVGDDLRLGEIWNEDRVWVVNYRDSVLGEG